jgi:hypothetical protein
MWFLCQELRQMSERDSRSEAQYKQMRDILAVTGPAAVISSSKAFSSAGVLSRTRVLLTDTMVSPSFNPLFADGHTGSRLATELGFCVNVKSVGFSMMIPTGYVERCPSFNGTAIEMSKEHETNRARTFPEDDGAGGCFAGGLDERVVQMLARQIADINAIQVCECVIHVQSIASSRACG